MAATLRFRAPTEESWEEQDCGYDTPCWVWQRARYTNGYGFLNVRRDGRRSTSPAHRIVYELERGPIPDGLDLDHLCRNRACVNPAHLEPVSRSVNLRRGATTKLTADAVRRARAAVSRSGELQAIAEEFGVSVQSLYCYRQSPRRYWSEAA